MKEDEEDTIEEPSPAPLPSIDKTGVDLRIMVTYCPGKMGMPFTNDAAHVFDRAGVEQVFCSRKVEDADRKIVTRLQQESEVLPPERTAFVVISSDLDFNTHCGFLTARGFTVVVLHGSQSQGVSATHGQSLALNASATFVWDSIVDKSTSHTTKKVLLQERTQRQKKRNGTQSSDLLHLLAYHRLHRLLWNSEIVQPVLPVLMRLTERLHYLIIDTCRSFLPVYNLRRYQKVKYMRASQ